MPHEHLNIGKMLIMETKEVWNDCPQCFSEMTKDSKYDALGCDSCEYRIFDNVDDYGWTEQYFIYPKPKERYMVTRSRIGTGITFKKCSPGATVEDLTGLNGIFFTKDILDYESFKNIEKINMIILFS